MAHRAQIEFIASVAAKFPQMFKGTHVMEIGSRNINGTVRRFFTECDYLGIDAVDGPGVDYVCLAHEYDESGYLFDVIISCEVFEHDPHLPQTIDMAMSWLRPGGLFVATWAGPRRPEHGTKRSGDSEFGPDADYYHGLGVGDVRDIIGDRLTDVYAEDTPNMYDARLYGIRS